MKIFRIERANITALDSFHLAVGRSVLYCIVLLNFLPPIELSRPNELLSNINLPIPLPPSRTSPSLGFCLQIPEIVRITYLRLARVLCISRVMCLATFPLRYIHRTRASRKYIIRTVSGICISVLVKSLNILYCHLSKVFLQF